MKSLMLLMLPMALAMQIEGDAAPHTMALAVAGAKVEALSEMERVFARSEETHQESMDKISKSLDFKAAMNVVKHSTYPEAGSTLAKVRTSL